MSPNKLEAIILDFDGVVLDSSTLKSKIFERFYGSFEDVGNDMIAFHYANKGMSRYNQFIELCRCLGEEPSKENVEKYISEFRDILMSEMYKCPFIKGAEGFLDCFYTKLPLFVASNSPKVELQSIVKKRKIDNCFVSLYGTTFQEKKSDFIMDILQKNEFCAKNVLFIGDTLKDMEAAAVCGVDFIGVDNILVRFADDVISFDSMTKIKDYILKNYTFKNRGSQ